MNGAASPNRWSGDFSDGRTPAMGWGYPGKFSFDEIHIDLLQPGEDIRPGDDQPGNIQGALAAGRVIAVPGKQRQGGKEKAIQVDPRLPAGLIQEAEHGKQSEKGPNEF